MKRPVYAQPNAERALVGFKVEISGARLHGQTEKALDERGYSRPRHISFRSARVQVRHGK